MKLTLAAFTLFFSLTSVAAPGEISGVVTVPKELEKSMTPSGVLYVMARKAGSPGGMPLAVARIPNPKFPQKFTMGAKDLMSGGKFEGSLAVTARYSPTGDAMDKSGPEGTDSKKPSVEPGETNLKIELKAKK